MALIDEALRSSCIILSSAGAHAQEEWLSIIDRKTRDIKNTKHTVWVTNSQAARPEIVQSFCADKGARHVMFLARQRNKPGKNTSNNNPAARYSGQVCELLDILV